MSGTCPLRCLGLALLLSELGILVTPCEVRWYTDDCHYRSGTHAPTHTLAHDRHYRSGSASNQAAHSACAAKLLMVGTRAEWEHDMGT